MVVRRTIENLRQRPHEERTAFAASVALGVVAILLIGWVVYFFHSIATTPAPTSQNTGQADASALQQAQQQMQQAYASTTSYMDIEGNIETQQVATSTDSQ